MSRFLDGTRWRAISTTSIGISLAACCYFFLRHLSQFYDIDMHDESLYLSGGSGLFTQHASWAPIYSIFYKIIFLFKSDFVQVYFLSAQCLSAFLVIALYIFLLTLNVEAWIAGLLSFAFLISSFNAPLAPRSHQFSSLVLVAGLIAINGIKRPTLQIWFAFALAILTVYIRPEFQIAAAILFVYGLFLSKSIAAEFVKYPFRALLVSFAIIGSVLVAFHYGSPNDHRNQKAFYQNFAEVYRLRTDHPHMTEDQITKYVFGGETKPGDAIRNHVAEYAHHVLFNFWSISVADLIDRHFNRFDFGFGPKFQSRCETVIALALFLGLLVLAVTRVRFLRVVDLRATFECRKHILVLLAVFNIPPLVLCLLMQSRERYLVFFVITLFVIAAFGISTLKSTIEPSSARWRALVPTLIAALLMPTLIPDMGRPINQSLVEKSRPTLDLINSARQLPTSNGVCFVYPHFIGNYIPRCRAIVSIGSDTIAPIALAKIIEENNASVVALNAELWRRLSEFNREQEFSELVSAPEKFNLKLESQLPDNTFILSRKPTSTKP